MACNKCLCNNCHEFQECIAIPPKILQKLDGNIPIRSGSKLAKAIAKEALTVTTKTTKKDTNDMTFADLLQSVVLNVEMDIKRYLKSQDASMRGNIYQALWMIVIMLDKLDPFTTKHFKILNGKIESEKDILNPKYFDKETFLKTKFLMGNKLGISDLTFEYIPKTGGKDVVEWACQMNTPFQQRRFVLCSFKFYNQETGIYNYDIQDIVEAMEAYKKLSKDTDYNVMLFVNNKEKLAQKIKQTSKKHFVEDIASFSLKVDGEQNLKEVMVETVYDLNDLLRIIDTLRQEAKHTNYEHLVSSDAKLKYLVPRFHQLLFVNMTLDRILHQEEKLVLWGQIARSGKTYTSGLLVSKLHQEGYFDRIRHEKKRPAVIMVITPAPGETVTQFDEELFSFFNGDFPTDQFNVLKFDRASIKNKALIHKDKHSILIASKQFLQGRKESTSGDSDEDDDANNEEYYAKAKNNIQKQLLQLRDEGSPKVDLIIYDEIHSGGSTRISHMILEVLDSTFNRMTEPVNDGRVVKVFLTATYKKPVDIFRIPKHQLLTWSLDDIQLCKYISSDQTYTELCDKFNTQERNYVQDTLDELKMSEGIDGDELKVRIQRQYNSFPTLAVMTSMYDEEWIKKTMNFNINEYSADFTKAFALVPPKDKDPVNGHRRFINEVQLRNLLIYIGSPHKPNSIRRRISQTFEEHQQVRPFISQLWFIPYFRNNKIVDVSASVRHFMMNDASLKTMYEDYLIVIADEKVRKDDIKALEVKARVLEHKKGVIVLAGKKFSLGVSFPCVDVVMFLNNDIDVDIIYQRMFRALTESRNKKLGILVDMNPYRTIQTLMEYTVPERVIKDHDAKEKQWKAKFDYVLKNQTIYFDSDKMGLTNKHQTTYNSLYKRIEENMRIRYIDEDVSTIKQEIEVKLASLLTDTMSDTILDLFVATKKDSKVLKILEGEKIDKAKLNKGKTEKDKKDTKKAEKHMLQKQALSVTLASIFAELTVVLPLVLGEGSTQLHEDDFTDIMKIIAIKVSSIEHCRDIDDTDMSHEDQVLLTMYSIIYHKVVAASTKDARNDTCRLVNSYLKGILKIINKYNMSDYFNKQYKEMKATINVTTSEDNIDKLHAFVEKYLPPKDHEKKVYGEVFTPLKLVNEMLTAIETYGDKNIWTNPNLKILDPAAGIGNFPLIAYQKLMKGLTHVKGFKDPEKRRKHILENMLYMVELNPVNSRLMEKIFNGKKYELNILTTSFLLESEKDINNDLSLTKKQKQDGKKLLQWKRDIKFDIIMGNPPYNASGNVSTGNTLWQTFIWYTVPMIGDSGFLTYVHPCAWRKPAVEKSKSHGLFELMTKKNQMLYLECHGADDGKKVFNSGTSYDWYVMCKRLSTKPTRVKPQQGNLVTVDLITMPFLPNHSFQVVSRLLADANEERCRVIYDRSAYGADKDWVKSDEWIDQHKQYTAGYKRVLIHSTPQSGTRYQWTNVFTKDKGKMFGVSKVIFGESGIYDVIKDVKGQYAMTQGAMAIAAKPSELDQLASYLLSKEFQLILAACQWSNYRIDWQLFTFFKRDFWKLG